MATLQISKKLLNTLKERKLYERESYEEVIWDIVENTQEVNRETRKEIEQARADIRAGRFYTHEQIKKRLGI